VPRRPAALAPDVAAGLLARWREPHRRHHGERHLAEVLDAIGVLARPGDDVSAVELAAWFHDAVYAGRPDDEERSAALARTELAASGAAAALVDEVVRLVLLTRSHDPQPDDRLGALLCDADLSVLGADPDRYAEYVADVRAEYAALDDATWRTGRAGVLRRLLALEPMFRTPAARNRWERAARDNLTAELHALTP
jgi:predicted metal-dependent HD superfamily phosphohydrolase